jgi:HlyD family secretion protein|uniref:HlyD family efflux transporter periplasmic adaptor subunit n=1 Tax=Desulfomonile tiedjei TaxID=2358 RepID=A0A7C4AT34_9BACT
MKKRILFAVLIAACAALAAAVWFTWNGRNNASGSVFVSGNIEATEVDLSFRIAGQIKTRPVDEGDRVTEGQVVATLDTDTLEALRGAAKAELDAAQANLDELEEGYRKEEIDMARAQFKAAESKLKNAKDEYERYLPLYKQGAISPSTFDLRETALKVATEEYNNARHALLKLETGPREQEIRAARSRLERAKWELNRIELDLEHSILKSPITGVVLVKAGEVGEVVLPGATVLTVAAIDEVWLRGYVSERDLGKVKLGQKAHITTDAFPNKIYEGSVTYISSRAEFTPKNVQTKEERVKQVYRVKITIPNPHQELKIGMPAEGYILTDEAPTAAQGHAKPADK